MKHKRTLIIYEFELGNAIFVVLTSTKVNYSSGNSTSCIKDVTISLYWQQYPLKFKPILNLVQLLCNIIYIAKYNRANWFILICISDTRAYMLKVQFNTTRRD